MKYFIDYSKIDKDTSYFIDFIIDKTGNINNINIKSKHNKLNPKGDRFAKIIYESSENKKSEIEKVVFSETEKSIANSILDFKNRLNAGVKDGQNVNTKINLELRLIPK